MVWNRRARQAAGLCLAQAPVLNPRLRAAMQRPGEYSAPCEIVVSFVTDEEIAQLNGEYRHKPRPTDVLSFSQYDGLEDEGIEGITEPWPDDEEAPLTLGDVVLSIETAQRQAVEHGHALADEIAFLTVHGTLHLLGYDHADDAGRRVMWRWQNRILDEIKKRKRLP